MLRLLLVTVLLLWLYPASALGALTERVSLSSEGEEGLGDSHGAAISADGRFVAFNSEVPDLVPEDTNGAIDVFVRQRQTGATEHVSVSTDGVQGNGPSYPIAISGAGRYAAFQSYASNLVASDTNEALDVFVRDREAGTTERVSLTSSGGQVAGHSYLQGISADGRYVLFHSDASGIVPGDDNSTFDGFLRDREAGTTECVTLSNAGIPVGNSGVGSISSDARYVTFVSDTPGIVPEDTNAFYDAFVRDRVAGATHIVSVDGEGKPLGKWCGLSTITADGRFVLFNAFDFDLAGWQPSGPNLIYVRDLIAGTTEVMTASENLPGSPTQDPTMGWYLSAMTPDARYVVFYSSNPNLVPQDTNGRTDVFIRDRVAESTVRVSVSSAGSQGNSRSIYPGISADGRFVAFISAASNLVPWDYNESDDVFVRDWQTPSSFADVLPTQWAWAQVETCCAGSIVSGYDDGLYHPGWPVSRAQMAVYVSRFAAKRDANVPDPDPGLEASFLDVPEQHWAYKYVEYAVAERIVAGYADGTYRPDAPVSRGQMSVFMARTMGWIDIEDGMATAPDLFEDVPAGYWAGTAIEACLDHGLIKGYARNYYLPEAILTRDEMAVFIASALDLLN